MAVCKLYWSNEDNDVNTGIITGPGRPQDQGIRNPKYWLKFKLEFRLIYYIYNIVSHVPRFVSGNI